MCSSPLGSSPASIGGLSFGSSFFFQNFFGSSCVSLVSVTSARCRPSDSRIGLPSARSPARYPLISSAQTRIRRHVQGRRVGCQYGAGGKPDEIAGKGQLAGVVEVVDSPHQPLLRVAPHTEVLDVQIADRKQDVLVSRGKPRAYLGPPLDPAVESRPQKGERPRPHLAVLVLEQALGNVRPFPHPRLVGAGGFEDAAHVSPAPSPKVVRRVPRNTPYAFPRFGTGCACWARCSSRSLWTKR